MSGKIEIDEKGFVKNLKRLGFTHHQCFAELMTNSLDAKAKNINIIKNKKDVRIIDDGLGMNMDLLRDKYRLMKQRNRTRDTTGCAGIGGTASEFILAKEKSIVLSKMEDCEDIVVAEVNWMLAHKEFKLFDSIHFRLATEEESELFYSERDGTHGTTTVLYFIPEDDNNIQEVLENQFDVKKKKKINPFERFDIIFGLKRCNITYNYWKNTNTLSLNLYNIRDYLNDNMNYKSNRYEIQILRNLDNKDEYIYVADNRVIDVHGTTSKGKNSYKSKLSKYHPYAETEKVGILVLHLYNPYQTDRFNLELPSLPGAGNILNDFEKTFFENDPTSRDFIMEMQVYRNNHYIGNKKLSKDFNRTNSRANGSAANKLFYSRSFLEFFVESNEDDINTPILDDFFGVQLNKNQNNQNTLPIPLSRLIENLIDEFHGDVWKYFETFIKEFNHKLKIDRQRSIGLDLIGQAETLYNSKKYDDNIAKLISHLNQYIITNKEDELVNEVNKIIKLQKKLKDLLGIFKKTALNIEKIYTNNRKPKPAPVEPKPAPVEPKPSPVEPKPAPVEPKPAPVEPKPTIIGIEFKSRIVSKIIDKKEYDKETLNQILDLLA